MHTNREVLRTSTFVKTISPLSQEYSVIQITHETIASFYPEIEDLWQFLSNTIP